jgi:hypothetical protein
MRFILDECMTLKASQLLIAALKLHKPPIEAQFLEHYLGSKGGLDVDWTKKLEEEGDWCVITCDNGRERGEKARLKGPPLHLICPYRKITGFFLSGKMAQRSGFEKARCIFYTLPELLEYTETAPRGDRFKISPSRTGYAIYPWPLTSTLLTTT